MTEHRSTARNEDQAESGANLWVWLIGLALLVFFHLYHGYARSLQIPEAFDTVAELVFRDLGVALIVAATVAWMFDKGYHRKMFGRPLREAVTLIRETTATLETTTDVARSAVESASVAVKEVAGNIHGELLETIQNIQTRDETLKAQYDNMVRGFQLLGRSNNEGIVAIHERGDDFQTALRAAVRSAERYCWVIGRTHTEMLGLPERGKGWLIEDLETKLSARKAFELSIVLANPFDPEDGLADAIEDHVGGREWPPTTNAARGHVHNLAEARKHVVGLFPLFDGYQSNERIKIRLLKKYPVPYCIVLTDQRLFVEQYLPSRAGGALFILEIETRRLKREPFACYESDFKEVFRVAESCQGVLSRYLARRQQEALARAQRDEDDELQDVANALAIARRWSAAPDAPPTGVAVAKRSRKSCAFAQQQEAYWKLIEYIGANPVDKAVLIQYSGARAEDVLLALMNKRVSTDLYVQAPEKAISERQRERIQETLNQMEDVVMTTRGSGQMRLIEYTLPASIRAILIDDEVLVWGSYVYHDIANPVPAYPNDNIRIHGHDAPGLLLWSGTPEFEVFRNAFVELAANLEASAARTGNLDRRASLQAPLVNVLATNANRAPAADGIATGAETPAASVDPRT